MLKNIYIKKHNVSHDMWCICNNMRSFLYDAFYIKKIVFLVIMQCFFISLLLWLCSPYKMLCLVVNNYSHIWTHSRWQKKKKAQWNLKRGNVQLPIWKKNYLVTFFYNGTKCFRSSLLKAAQVTRISRQLRRRPVALMKSGRYKALIRL